MIHPCSTSSSSHRRRAVCAVIVATATWLSALIQGPTAAVAAPGAGAYLVFDVGTGEIVARHNADQAWYPASITKLMTTWVVLQSIRAGRLKPTSPVPMTATAARQPPSKMGFKPGEVVTVDNALKIIMVKSANDVAWALGEAVGGSKEAFVGEMNRQAQLLGMRSTRWGNPNGLPDPSQVTTAHDLGLLARALLREFPEADGLWHLPGIQYGNEVIRNHNHLIDHFPGTDGMKTGFICSSGFNVVATASRGNRRLVAVVLGSRSARARAELAAELFTRGFEGAGSGNFFGRFTTPETLDHMARGPEAANPVRDVKQEICGKKRNETPPDVEDLGEVPQMDASRENLGGVIKPGEHGSAPVKRASYLSQRFDIGPPVRVWLGGADAAPGDAGSMLALAPSTSPAGLMAAPTFATASAPPLPGAIRPRPLGLPPTGPGAGAGLGDSLAPADGAPMMIAGPAATPTTAKPKAAAAAPSSVKTASPKATPAKATPAKPTPAKAAASKPAPAAAKPASAKPATTKPAAKPAAAKPTASKSTTETKPAKASPSEAAKPAKPAAPKPAARPKASAD